MEPAVRVNRNSLREYVGKNVRFVGKVVRCSYPVAILDAPDGGQVQVQMSDGASYGSTFVEVIGEVNQDLSIREFTFNNFGDDFDLANYNEMVALASNQFRELFA
eukprot:GILK01009570.1.p1 GENE.GILK01009570.1~~GILK01009570.1.p1  ORF type:complete len:116 (-),score=8.04 GILK01009570.1:105-419(-)